MSQHHRIEKADPLGEPGRQEQGNGGKDGRGEEDGTQGFGRQTEALVQVIRDQRLGHEAATERVEREEGRDLADVRRNGEEALRARLPLDELLREHPEQSELEDGSSEVYREERVET